MGLTQAKGAALRLDDRLASTANGEGASLVAIEDAAGNFSSSNVEGALAELFGSFSGFLNDTVNTAVNITIDSTYLNKLVNATSALTISLQEAAIAGTGFVFAVYNASTTASDVVNIAAFGAELINDSPTLNLAKGDWCILTCTGSQWKALVYSPPAASSLPANVASTKLDPLLQYYGDGSDGAFSSIGDSTLSTLLSQHTTFALNIGHTMTINTPVCIIRATTSITIDGTVQFDAVDIIKEGISTGLSLQGTGGGGGGGGADALESGYDGENSNPYVNLSSVSPLICLLDRAAGGIGAIKNNSWPYPSGTAGANGNTPSASEKKYILENISKLLSRMGVGGTGGAGGPDSGNPGGSGGLGGESAGIFILIAPIISINASAILNMRGANGNPGSAASNKAGGGGGGGGAGGVLVCSTEAYTNAGTVNQTGGTGGVGGNGFNNPAGGNGGDGGAGADGYILTVDPTA